MTVQGPVKEQQPDGMSHRGGGGIMCRRIYRGPARPKREGRRHMPSQALALSTTQSTETPFPAKCSAHQAALSQDQLSPPPFELSVPHTLHCTPLPATLVLPSLGCRTDPDRLAADGVLATASRRPQNSSGAGARPGLTFTAHKQWTGVTWPRDMEWLAAELC